MASRLSIQTIPILRTTAGKPFSLVNFAIIECHCQTAFSVIKWPRWTLRE